ncbi:hypothetical protein LEMA_P122440.1 [Plenodomus lingam JN3]|uniref:AP-2 complex subunit sigma n=1 Tax=Leptosphaeria maculans (strain JN3 / isolate v23.1.3 / race Av1-4-5-6-7-8) TaxID=985895 RepID=E4ZS85_LEPMJ|nr:hypothetical protein LEMA_P122440.1 [Plenodomus lingam JN3]CBX94265.1 hypothetical protein LEMA_P122440.1 [Plenodomus lingam JN3]
MRRGLERSDHRRARPVGHAAKSGTSTRKAGVQFSTHQPLSSPAQRAAVSQLLDAPSLAFEVRGGRWCSLSYSFRTGSKYIWRRGMLWKPVIDQPNRGKTRLAKWYAPYSDEEKVKLKGEVHRLIAPRDQKHQSNFVEFRNMSKIVYRRYAGLFFCACVDTNDNELAYLEAIHFFVEVLDAFFGNVCELDLVFNFYKVYAILDEVFLAGEIEETSKQVVLTRLQLQGILQLQGLPRVAGDVKVEQMQAALCNAPQKYPKTKYPN